MLILSNRGRMVITTASNNKLTEWASHIEAELLEAD